MAFLMDMFTAGEYTELIKEISQIIESNQGYGSRHSKAVAEDIFQLIDAKTEGG